MEPYSRKKGKFKAENVNGNKITRKQKEEVRNANRSLKKSSRQQSKREIKKFL